MIAPEIEDTEKALQNGLQSLTWANQNRRDPAAPQPHPASREQRETRQRNNTPPPIPERNPERLGLERQVRESPEPSQGIPQHHQEHRRRATSPTDAEVSRYLRRTRPGHQRRETSPEPFRGNPTIQEVVNRRDFPATHEGLHHPQPRRALPEMAGTRSTGYLDVAAASTSRITPHQQFLKGQVKRQQDATDEWARRTGKPAPPYQFEDFIGKGAYGRVFKA